MLLLVFITPVLLSNNNLEAELLPPKVLLTQLFWLQGGFLMRGVHVDSVPHTCS